MKQFPQVTFNGTEAVRLDSFRSRDSLFLIIIAIVTCIPYFLQVELPEEGVLFDDYIKSRYGDLKSFKRGEQGLVQMGIHSFSSSFSILLLLQDEARFFILFKVRRVIGSSRPPA